ncbi:AAA family ATPase [Runella sp.]|uniref:AAA family ATPase n=1 Tax=Runella sp. TaxID=1960881 RepID=UPI003D105355
MKKGLIFGKFMPFHKGHKALIDFALSQCEKVIVSMSYTPTDPIPSDIRFQWLHQLFDHDPRIQLFQALDDFPDEELPLIEATKLWATFIHQTFPDIEGVFCSEEYGVPLSQHLNCPVLFFDLNRVQVPISATAIRANPYLHWDFIPEVIKPYFTKKICVYGPESTGKTTLTQQLADHFQTTFAHETARDVLTSNDFGVETIIEIGRLQTALVKQRLQTANKVLFCDTDLITTQIYSRHYFGYVTDALKKLEREVSYDLYLLLNIDTPWVADSLRDMGHRRAEMFAVFKDELQKRRLPYVLIEGTWEERFAGARKQVEKLLENP